VTGSRHADPCARFAAELAPLLLGDLDAAAAALLVAHKDACARCAEAFRAAADTDRLLAQWRVPAPSPHLSARILEAIETDDAGARWRATLDAWIVPSRTDDQRRALADAVLRRVAPRRAARVRVAAGLLAAGLLAAATLLLHTSAAERGREPEPASFAGTEDFAPPIDDLLQRNHEIRVRTVRHRQFPSEIGAFDAQPILADRGMRKTGNQFHRTLRRVLSGEETPGTER
jgi:hypothetical protein